MAADAKRMPSREAEYRNLVLNQRVEATSPFISRSTWQGCEGRVVGVVRRPAGLWRARSLGHFGPDGAGADGAV